jgi:iron complex outermembrane receptor protein
MMALACALAAGAAEAQTVSGIEVRATGAGALGLTTPVETGSRLGLTPLETPASIEVVSGETIRARGDISLADAISRSTGIVQQNDPGNGSTASFAARGFNGVGSVMVLYDGMRLFVGAGTVTFPFDPWTVQQVEVLKGPSSVLYGQGAIGGAVNIVPKRAGFGAPSYEFQLGGGSDRTYRAAVGVGAPLGETLAVRADVSRVGSNGYVDRGDSDSWALSGSVAWKAAPNLTFTLSDDYGDQRPMRYFGVPLIDGRIEKSRRELNYNVFDSIVHYKDNAGQLRMDWQPAEGVKVRNAAYILTTRRQWRNAEIYAFDPPGSVVRSGYTPIKHNERQVGDSLDVSFASKLGAMDNTLLVGAEANKIRFVHTNDGFPETESVVDAFDPDPGLFDEEGAFVPRYRTNTRQGGLFAEDQLKITPEISIVGGLRYDHYHVKRQDLIAGQQVVDKTLKNTSWRIGAVYQPTPGLSLYAQYATGADPLGSLITTSSSQAPFELSTGRQYEAGVKGQMLGGRAEWTLAAFKIVKEKLLTRDRANPNQQIQVGQRSSKGLEASLALQLLDGLSLDANGSILDAEFDDFTETVGGVPVSRNGLTPPNTPEKTANVWLSWQVVPKVRLYSGVRYVGRQFGDNANSANLVLPSYTVADAGLEWTLTPHLSLNAQLFNALDNTYAYTAYSDEQWTLGRPRAFEVRLNGRF